MKKEISRSDLINEVKSLELRVKRKPMKRDDNSLNYKAKKLFGSWSNLMRAAGYNAINYQKINSIKQNEDFAYFLGLLITDGHIRCDLKKKNYKIAIYTSYIEEKEMISKLIKDLFDYNPAISERVNYGFSRRSNFEIRISSKWLLEFISEEYEIPIGAKSTLVRVPNKIKNGNKEIKMAFLKGVIDGDGWISKNRLRIGISSGSTKFLEELKELLKELGITSGKIAQSYYGGNSYSFEIGKHDDVLKFKGIYEVGKYCYPRKKLLIDKI